MSSIPLSHYYDSPPSRRGVVAPLARASHGTSDWRLRRAERPTLPAVHAARDVTRVESIKPLDGARFAKIDWLNCTFAHADDYSPREMALMVRRWIGARGAWTERDGGLFGFTERHRIGVELEDGSRLEVGCFAFGGDSQMGRGLLQLTGKGCGLVRQWPAVLGFLRGVAGAISRVDLAVDFLSGERTVDDVLDLYQEGAFINRGRNPGLDMQGAWLPGEVNGRTVYVGKLKNGKALCVYEKGKQLKDFGSNWTRYEVRLGNRDRVIPLDVLTDPDKYFCGAYPALAGLVGDAAERIPTVKREATASLAALMHHMERCYGKAIHQVIETTGVEASALVEEVRVVGLPRKFDPAGERAQVSWSELCARKRHVEAGNGGGEDRGAWASPEAMAKYRAQGARLMEGM